MEEEEQDDSGGPLGDAVLTTQLYREQQGRVGEKEGERKDRDEQRI